MSEQKYLNHWIDKHGWELHSWRAQGETWVAIAPRGATLELVRDGTRSESAAPFREALESAAVLPVRSGPSLASAMEALEERLSQLPSVEHARGSRWGAQVESLYRQVEHQARQQLLNEPGPRGLAERLERRFGVACTPLPSGSSSGQLVDVVPLERGGALAALRTQDGLHLWLATQRDLQRSVGRNVDVHAGRDGVSVTQDMSRAPQRAQGLGR